MSFPPKRIFPEVNSVKPKIRFAIVVLPLPLSPAIVVMVAGDSGIFRLNSFRATNSLLPAKKLVPALYIFVAFEPRECFFLP